MSILRRVSTMSSSDSHSNDIYNYFCDSKVYFPNEKEGGSFISIDIMEKCFSIIEVYGDYLVLQLKLNATLEDCLRNFLSVPLENSNKVALVKLYTNKKYYYDIDGDLPKLDVTVDIDSYKTHIDAQY